MKLDLFESSGRRIPVYSLDCIVIGSGCAAFNAADWLYDLNKRDIAIITEGMNMGTSRNTGSDKQTYYKLSLASDSPDSVSEIAHTLFSGGSVDGDTALVEAACSVKSFIKLANLGVPFPTNIYGEYVGYKTDHDPRQRATSAGPLTSKYMTECLERSVKGKGIKIFDCMQAISIIVNEGKAVGIIALDINGLDNGSFGLTMFNCANIIMATGGPAGVYLASVYPESQTGMSGMALEAGAQAVNLDEWQYGLASTKFRWNVSGTYQQVLPKYITVDKDGNTRELLPEYFDNPKTALDMVFLKGYQWPFDIAKVQGSSVIDIIIHHEIFNKGNRVYMDFREEPAGLEDGFGCLGKETYHYLFRSEALIKTPVKRLEKMNRKAIELYLSHGIDLYREPLEVAVCPQHQNGGIAVDINWQSSIKGLYAAGEAAGTFGVYRPGGSALNSTQVGSMRAAEHIAYENTNEVMLYERFMNVSANHINNVISNIVKVTANAGAASNIMEKRSKAQKRMSRFAAHIRTTAEIEKLKSEIEMDIPGFFENSHIETIDELPQAFKTRDILITQAAILSAMHLAASETGSRGSGLVLHKDGEVISPKLTDFNYIKPKGDFGDKKITTFLDSGGFGSRFEEVRPFPSKDDWFESVWNGYINRTEKSSKKR